MSRAIPHSLIHLVLMAFLLCGTEQARAQRVPIDLSNDNFSAESLVRGVAATPAQCSQITQAVWARASTGEQECIRYWATGLAGDGTAARVLVYIPGDQLAFDQADASYAGRNPTIMQAMANTMQARIGVPFILLSRPGTFGSSGEHKQRRREPELRLMSAALDEIRTRHGVREFVLVGLSGGGHIVASVLGWRQDIVCAVPTSSVSSPRLRWQRMGRDSDLTGFKDSYEPVDHLKPGSFHPRLRVFVLGDTRDSNVLWATQTPLADRLREVGVDTHLLNGEGSDPQRHNLGASGQRVGAQCLLDKPTPEILDLAAQGLKG